MRMLELVVDCLVDSMWASEGTDAFLLIPGGSSVSRERAPCCPRRIGNEVPWHSPLGTRSALKVGWAGEAGGPVFCEVSWCSSRCGGVAPSPLVPKDSGGVSETSHFLLPIFIPAPMFSPGEHVPPADGGGFHLFYSRYNSCKECYQC